MCKHEINSCLLVLVLFVLYILIIYFTFVLSTLAAQWFVCLFIYICIYIIYIYIYNTHTHNIYNHTSIHIYTYIYLYIHTWSLHISYMQLFDYLRICNVTYITYLNIEKKKI